MSNSLIMNDTYIPHLDREGNWSIVKISPTEKKNIKKQKTRQRSKSAIL